MSQWEDSNAEIYPPIFPIGMIRTEIVVLDSCLPREGELEQAPPGSTLNGIKLLMVSHMVVGVLMTRPQEGIFLN
jgi:hypothetical protein